MKFIRKYAVLFDANDMLVNAPDAQFFWLWFI